MEIKTSLVATFLFLYLGFSAIANSSQSSADSCSSNLTLSGIPFATTSLTCQSVWISQGFILRYRNSGSLWNFILSTPATNAYVAIGFSPDGRMAGSSSIVGWVPSGSKGIVKQYYLGGYDSQSCAPDKGDLKLSNMTIISQSSRFYLAFSLITSQPQSNLIYAIGPANSLPSSPEYLMSRHQSMTATTLNLVTGQSTSKGNGSESESEPSSNDSESGSKSSSQSSSSGFRNACGVVNILRWAIFMFIIGNLIMNS
uniref:DOMON domain-containing protein n=1 Tax=Nelumbo nucifera TaxID=4432 RepID=A0A822ZIJ7_NELNU|nr:TPA_asm: hypothetical protein HUJ06_001691 [Nelumbo nucifera]